MFSTASADESATKRDVCGGVTVTVSLLGTRVADGPLKVKVVLDTHSVDLDGVVFENAVALRTSDGTDAPPRWNRRPGMAIIARP